MRSLDDFACRKLEKLDRALLRRTLAECLREGGPWVNRGGRRLLSFSCNDYLNLSSHPALKAAAIAAIGQHGVGAGASRLVTGSSRGSRGSREPKPPVCSGPAILPIAASFPCWRARRIWF